MRRMITLILLLGVTNAIRAQIIPEAPTHTDSTKKASKSTTAKSKIGLSNNANNAVIKFVCDADAILFIDGVKKGSLTRDFPIRISLPKGDYLVKAVNSANTADRVEFDYTVGETGVEKLQNIALQSVITQRLNAETAAAEAQRKKDAEFNFSDDFSDNRNFWPVGYDNTREISINNGALTIKVLANRVTFPLKLLISIGAKILAVLS